MANSGGVAVNSGINFQHRVGAFALVHLLMGLRNFAFFGLSEDWGIDEVRFETNDAVDDLVLSSSAGKALIQSKRSIFLSEDINSELSSAISQFVREFVRNPNNSDSYIIATSPSASKKIRVELMKLTESARLNDAASTTNPLTASEKEVLAKTYSLIEYHLAVAAVSQVENFRAEIFKRIRVASLDIENGGSGENAVLTLLTSKSSVSPALLWDSLISLSATLSKDRASVKKDLLLKRMGQFLQAENKSDAVENKEFFLSRELRGKWSFGRDIVLVEKLVGDERIGLLQLRRFDSDGKRRYKFSNGKIVLKGMGKLDVIHRTATVVGFERYLQNNTELLSEKGLVIVPPEGAQEVENEKYVKLYGQRFEKTLKNVPLKCLNCGEPISENHAPLIEVDEVGLPNEVGMVHERCARPTNRILGIIECQLFREKNYLRNFDYGAWFEKMLQGVNVFNTTSHVADRLVGVLWNPNYTSRNAMNWCIKVDLDDGSAQYVSDRGAVERFSRQAAEKQAAVFNENYRDGEKRRDPWCYTSESVMYGTYNSLLRVMRKDDKLQKCLNATPVPYTSAIGKAYSTSGNYYTPLVKIISEETGEVMEIQGYAFLISDPLMIEKYVKNWTDAGLDLSKFLVSIIGSDDEFDVFVHKCANKNVKVVVDPLFRLDGALNSGFLIDNISRLQKGNT
jgi:hypothetical protein